MTSRLLLHVLLSSLVLVALPARAYLSGVEVVDPPVLAGEPLTVEVLGDAPNPCYGVAVVTDDGDTAEPGRIRIVVELRDETPPGVGCVMMIQPYEVQRTFADGFPAGSYVIEVVERTFVAPLPQERTLEATLEIVARDAVPVDDTSGWGAVKALYATGE